MGEVGKGKASTEHKHLIELWGWMASPYTVKPVQHVVCIWARGWKHSACSNQGGRTSLNKLHKIARSSRAIKNLDWTYFFLSSGHQCFQLNAFPLIHASIRQIKIRAKFKQMGLVMWKYNAGCYWNLSIQMAHKCHPRLRKLICEIPHGVTTNTPSVSPRTLFNHPQVHHLLIDDCNVIETYWANHPRPIRRTK